MPELICGVLGLLHLHQTICDLDPPICRPYFDATHLEDLASCLHASVKARLSNTS